MSDDTALRSLRERIKRHEGFRPRPYRDTGGHMTIGYGHRIRSGEKLECVTQEEADKIFEADLQEVMDKLNLPEQLSPVRKGVLIEMGFNLGITGLRKFKKMWAAISVEDFDTAADEMLDSKWSRQVKGRANTLANLMRSG